MKKVLLCGVICYTGYKVLEGYTEMVYNIGKLSVYMDIAKEFKNEKRRTRRVDYNKR